MKPPWMDNLISQTMMGMAVGNPKAQAKVMGITEPKSTLGLNDLFAAMRSMTRPKPDVIEEWWVPKGSVFQVNTALGPVWVVHPSTWLDIKYPNRHPCYTLGHAEMRRDKRKYRRK